MHFTQFTVVTRRQKKRGGSLQVKGREGKSKLPRLYAACTYVHLYLCTRVHSTTLLPSWESACIRTKQRQQQPRLVEQFSYANSKLRPGKGEMRYRQEEELELASPCERPFTSTRQNSSSSKFPRGTYALTTDINCGRRLTMAKIGRD